MPHSHTLESVAHRQAGVCGRPGPSVANPDRSWVDLRAQLADCPTKRSRTDRTSGPGFRNPFRACSPPSSEVSLRHPLSQSFRLLEVPFAPRGVGDRQRPNRPRGAKEVAPEVAPVAVHPVAPDSALRRPAWEFPYAGLPNCHFLSEFITSGHRPGLGFSRFVIPSHAIWAASWAACAERRVTRPWIPASLRTEDCPWPLG
jgi:hypothetical protein